MLLRQPPDARSPTLPPPHIPPTCPAPSVKGGHAKSPSHTSPAPFQCALNECHLAKPHIVAGRKPPVHPSQPQRPTKQHNSKAKPGLSPRARRPGRFDAKLASEICPVRANGRVALTAASRRPQALRLATIRLSSCAEAAVKEPPESRRAMPQHVAGGKPPTVRVSLKPAVFDAAETDLAVPSRCGQWLEQSSVRPRAAATPATRHPGAS